MVEQTEVLEQNTAPEGEGVPEFLKRKEVALKEGEVCEVTVQTAEDTGENDKPVTVH